MTNEQTLDVLKNSVTFNMSLGSKELFHSNFLYWLSQTNKIFFLEIMRYLAGHQNFPFWWEISNFEVKREYHNFDLCICVKYGNNNKRANREDKILMPVLILENKMKSLPQADQLEQYTTKARDLNEEARNKLATKSNIEKLSIDEKTEIENKGSNITFILLSLLDSDIETNWVKKNYLNLYKAFDTSKDKRLEGLTLDIVNDYMEFIQSLYSLANDWNLNVDDSFNRKLIFPDKDLEELRIHDIRDKIHSQLLLKLIRKGLKKDYNIHTNTGYTHQKGLIDVWWKYGDVNFKIQLQGNVYKHAIEVINNKNQNLDKYCKNEINDGIIKLFLNFTNESEIFKNVVVEEEDGSVKIMPKNNKQAGKKGYCDKYCYYGKTFAYRYIIISSCENISIDDVVKMIVNDVNEYYKKITMNS